MTVSVSSTQERRQYLFIMSGRMEHFLAYNILDNWHLENNRIKNAHIITTKEEEEEKDEQQIYVNRQLLVSTLQAAIHSAACTGQFLVFMHFDVA